jgi:hypothetical protein
MAEKKSFLLRISPEIFDALSRWAEDDLRSLNGQIEYLLRQALAQAGRLPQRPAAVD